MSPFIESALIVSGTIAMLAGAAVRRAEIRCCPHPREDRLSRHVR
jgi:hypothetical protein